MRITSLKNCLSTFIFFRVSFWALFLCISIESRTKLKKIWTKQTKQSGEEVRKLRYLSKWTAKKNEHGEGVMLIRTFVVKVIDNERKKLTHHKIIDRIAEQIASVIIPLSKESKLRIHRNLRTPHFSITYSFRLTYKCFVRFAFHNSYERYKLV